MSAITSHDKSGLIATCARGGTIRVWRVDEGESLLPCDSAIWESEPERKPFLDANQVSEMLPRLQGDLSVELGLLNDSQSLLMVTHTDGRARVWEVESGLPISETMDHPWQNSTLQILGAEFCEQDELVLTWTRIRLFHGDPPIRTGYQFRIWDARSGLPVSEPYSLPDEPTRVLVQPATWEITTGLGFDGKAVPEATWRRRLPTPPKVDMGMETYVSLATGTRVNEIGDFEFMTADEWRALNQRHPEYSAMGK